MTSRDTLKSKQDLEGNFLHFLRRAYIGNQVTILALFSVPTTQTLRLLKSPVRRNFNKKLNRCFLCIFASEAGPANWSLEAKMVYCWKFFNRSDILSILWLEGVLHSR